MIIDPSIVSVFNFWHGLVGKKKLSTPLKREPKRSKIAKFESYLLENNEDMAPPRGNILQTFLWCWAPTDLLLYKVSKISIVTLVSYTFARLRPFT